MWYAKRSSGKLMHRVIMGSDATQQVDHKDRDGLNNLRSNLRHCDSGENLMNRAKPDRCSSSKYKGVGKRGTRWGAAITIRGYRTYLGTYDTETQAAVAYDIAAVYFYKAFSLGNSTLYPYDGLSVIEINRQSIYERVDRQKRKLRAKAKRNENREV
jgi:hypothetical protein